MRLITTRNQRGDTIVEVLIAIAIVSLILTTAYLITARNTQAIQANQERSQAQHLVESQIESLKAKGSLDASGDCFIGAAETTGVTSNPNSDCGKISQTGSGATYTASISGPTGSNPGVYTVTATWTALGDTTNNASNVTMYYRLQ